MAKRKRARRQLQPAPTSSYTDTEGNVLELRQSLSAGTVAKIRRTDVKAAGSAEDVWERRSELMFERLAVSWEIAGLPITDQRTLLGRYRMASAGEREWVRRTITAHLERFIPELAG